MNLQRAEVSVAVKVRDALQGAEVDERHRRRGCEVSMHEKAEPHIFVDLGRPASLA